MKDSAWGGGHGLHVDVTLPVDSLCWYEFRLDCEGCFRKLGSGLRLLSQESK